MFNFSRLRLNFSVIKEEDRKFLLKAKLEIEKNWEKEKWERIAIKVQELGGDFYGVSLQRELHQGVFRI